MNMNNTPELQSSSYDQSKCDIGIIHFGLGGFHRAHQAFYIDQLMDETQDLSWGVAAVNIRAEDSDSFVHYMNNEDGYVLKTIDYNGQADYNLVRCHVNYTDYAQDEKAALELFALDTIEAITITVTESGYYLNQDGALDHNHPLIAAEIAGEKAKTIYGVLRLALKTRLKANAKPLTVLNCDNLRENGIVLSKNFTAYLKLIGDTDLIDWIEKNVSFPCSMVDRITPRPTEVLSKESETLFGRTKDMTVQSEDFIQWVIEDNFAGKRPNLDEVGVTYTKNVFPYEEAKIRILNAGHTSLCYLGVLKGYSTFDELMGDEELLDHFMQFQTKEVLPALDIDIPFDLEEYLQIIINRFKNVHISDNLERICMDGFNKFPIFVLPTIKSCFKQGITPAYGLKSIASWYVFCLAIYNKKFDYHYVEPSWKTLEAMLAHENANLFIENESLWGSLSTEYPEFKDIILDHIEGMKHYG